MEKFKKELKSRVVVGFGFSAIIILINIFVPMFFETSFKNGFVVGMFSGVAILAFIMAIQAAKALKDPEKLRKLYIEEHDERELEILDRAMKFALKFTLMLGLIATSICMYIDTKIAIGIIGTICFMSLLTFGAKVYYDKKI